MFSKRLAQKYLILMFLFSVIEISCGDGQTTTSQVQFDAEHSTAMEGVISHGHILTTSADRNNIQQNIGSQLMYVIGQLNGLGGAPDLNRTQISIDDISQQDDHLYDITYHAKLFIAWPRERESQLSYELIVPKRGDFEGQKALMDALVLDPNKDRDCLDWGTHDFSFANFWYYYRPDSSTCTPRLELATKHDLVTRFQLDLVRSAENTADKRPEYAKMWEDGRLIVTSIFGKNKPSSMADADEGVFAFRQSYDLLVSAFGQPLQSNLHFWQKPGAQHPTLKLVFKTPAGPLDIHLYLVDEIRNPTAEFEKSYNDRVAISDFVNYNGHAALGANIRAMAHMGHFIKGQYQLFLVNGCDTFAYVDDALRDAHQAANPEAPPYKYLDIITNAMPSLFSRNATTHQSLVNALVGRSKTYRQILSDFDPSQRPVVTGEQDND